MSTERGVSFETTVMVGTNCLCLYLQRAARALARRFDDAFRPLDLTSGQFSVMMSLNRPEPPTMGRVASGLGMDRTTLTAALKPLERRGLVEIFADPADRRSRLLKLTPAGMKLLTKAFPIWRRVHAEIEAPLPSGDPDRLRGDLRALAFPDEPGSGPP